jgi:hypothetical protein
MERSRALLDAEVDAFFASQTLMDGLSMLLPAPFAALAGADARDLTRSILAVEAGLPVAAASAAATGRPATRCGSCAAPRRGRVVPFEYGA